MESKNQANLSFTEPIIMAGSRKSSNVQICLQHCTHMSICTNAVIIPALHADHEKIPLEWCLRFCNKPGSCICILMFFLSGLNRRPMCYCIVLKIQKQIILLLDFMQWSTALALVTLVQVWNPNFRSIADIPCSAVQHTTYTILESAQEPFSTTMNTPTVKWIWRVSFVQWLGYVHQLQSISL